MLPGLCAMVTIPNNVIRAIRYLLSAKLCSLNSTLTILGSTGSIGKQTLDVVRAYPDRYSVAYLTTNKNVDLLEQQVAEFHPRGVVVCDPKAAEEAQRRLRGTVPVFFGEAACIDLATRPEVDVVMSAMVGFAGLAPTIAAAEAGKRIALANKETLVVAGTLVNRALKRSGAVMLPVDSEHSAVFQCLMGEAPESVEKILLTASGGPFREMPIEQFGSITLQQALRHPNWEMGAKITIDSATMMNKGLEVIEARRLFDVTPDRIGVVVHPESIIHSMVVFNDGSVKAQLSLPDMRMPIHFALAWPERIPAAYKRADFSAIGSLTFQEPDTERFPCLRLAYDALEREGTAPTVLNAANEVAVAAFLAGEIPFTDIPKLIETALIEEPITDDPSLQDIFDADKRTRGAVRSYLADLG